jgi:hypothetical protein
MLMFDQMEVSFIAGWNKVKSEELDKHLEESTRNAINEKNMYLTIFESIPLPLITLSKNLDLLNLNFEAQKYFLNHKSPGFYYYKIDSKEISKLNDIDFSVFLNFDFSAFEQSKLTEDRFDSYLGEIKISGTVMKNLDVSNKTSGYLIVIKRENS